MAKRTSSGFITMGEVGKLAAGIGVLIGAVVIALTFLGTKVDWNEVGMYATVFGAVLAAGVVLLAGWRWWTERRARGEAIEQGARFIEATGKAQAPPRELSPKHRQHWEALETKFKDILPKLGPEKLGKTPIFLVLGETSGGKSLAIHKSGIRWHPDFKPPQIQADSEQAGQGAGGTLGMEWWFGENEIIIDTAGELLESDEVSNVAWGKFIDNLRQHRKAPQFSGVMVFIPAGRLYDTKEGREQSALRLRSRLRALRDAYGLRFPVWIVISKADLVPGFTSFVRHLDMVDADKQLFGWTNADTDFDKAFEPAQIRGELGKMAERMRKLRRKMIGLKKRDGNAYGPADGADDLFRFPGELEKLAEPLEAYLADLFTKDGYAKNDSRTASRELRVPFVRGVYLTSAVQTGEVLDQELAAAMGLKVEDIKRVPPPDRKPYFVNRVFERMLIEKGLSTVHISVRLARLRRLALWSGVMGVLAIVFIAVAFYMNDQLNGAVKTPLARWTDRSDKRDWKWTSPAQATQWRGHWSKSEVLATWVGEAAGATKDGKVPWVFLPVALGERDVLGTRRKEVAHLVLKEHFVKPLLQLNEAALGLPLANSTKPAPANGAPEASITWDVQRMSALRGLWQARTSSNKSSSNKYSLGLTAGPAPAKPLQDLWDGAFGEGGAALLLSGVEWHSPQEGARATANPHAMFEVDAKDLAGHRTNFLQIPSGGNSLPKLLADFKLSDGVKVDDLVKATQAFGSKSTDPVANSSPSWWTVLARTTSKDYGKKFDEFVKVVESTRTIVKPTDTELLPIKLDQIQVAFGVHEWVKNASKKDNHVSGRIFGLEKQSSLSFGAEVVDPISLDKKFQEMSEATCSIEKELPPRNPGSSATPPVDSAGTALAGSGPQSSAGTETNETNRLWMQRLAAADGMPSAVPEGEKLGDVLMSGLRRYFEDVVKPEVRSRQLTLAKDYFGTLKDIQFREAAADDTAAQKSAFGWAKELDRWDARALQNLISSIESYNRLLYQLSGPAPQLLGIVGEVKKNFDRFVAKDLAVELQKAIDDDSKLVVWGESITSDIRENKVNSGQAVAEKVGKKEKQIKLFRELHMKLMASPDDATLAVECNGGSTGGGGPTTPPAPRGGFSYLYVEKAGTEAKAKVEAAENSPTFNAEQWDKVKRSLEKPCEGEIPIEEKGHPLLVTFAEKVKTARKQRCIESGKEIAAMLVNEEGQNKYRRPLVAGAEGEYDDWASLRDEAVGLVNSKLAIEAWLESVKDQPTPPAPAGVAAAALKVAQSVKNQGDNAPKYTIEIKIGSGEMWTAYERNGMRTTLLAGVTTVKIETVMAGAEEKVTLIGNNDTRKELTVPRWFMFDSSAGLKDEGEVLIPSGGTTKAKLTFKKQQ